MGFIVYIIKQYGTGDCGDFCDLWVFNDKKEAEKKLRKLFFNWISDNLYNEKSNFIDKKEYEEILKIAQEQDSFEREDDSGYISLSYYNNDSFNFWNHDTELRCITQIEKKNILDCI